MAGSPPILMTSPWKLMVCPLAHPNLYNIELILLEYAKLTCPKEYTFKTSWVLAQSTMFSSAAPHPTPTLYGGLPGMTHEPLKVSGLIKCFKILAVPFPTSLEMEGLMMGVIVPILASQYKRMDWTPWWVWAEVKAMSHFWQGKHWMLCINMVTPLNKYNIFYAHSKKATPSNQAVWSASCFSKIFYCWQVMQISTWESSPHLLKTYAICITHLYYPIVSTNQGINNALCHRSAQEQRQRQGQGQEEASSQPPRHPQGWPPHPPVSPVSDYITITKLCCCGWVVCCPPCCHPCCPPCHLPLGPHSHIEAPHIYDFPMLPPIQASGNKTNYSGSWVPSNRTTKFAH